MPAVFGYRRNEAFVAEQWLYEDTFNWGNHSKRTDAYGNTGSRSVMYIALRLLFYLGVRQLYLWNLRLPHGTAAAELRLSTRSYCRIRRGKQCHVSRSQHAAHPSVAVLRTGGLSCFQLYPE